MSAAAGELLAEYFAELQRMAPAEVLGLLAERRRAALRARVA